MNGRKLIVLLLAALALAAAGCGGDDSSDASGDTDTAVVEETTTEETVQETTAAEETTEETSADEDISALGGKCAELAGIGAKFSQATSGGNAGLEEVSKLFDELADNVPDEIKDDFRVLADNYSKLADELKGIDLSAPSAEDVQKMQEATASLNSPKLQQASENIQAWVTKNC